MNETTLNSLLQAVLFRTECPDTMILGDYQSNFLAPKMQREVSQHVADCPYCTTELGRLDNLLALPLYDEKWQIAPNFQWLKRAKEMVIQLLQPAATPQLAGVKGDAADILRRISLRPSENGGADVEAIVTADTDETTCTMIARVQIPDRWPDLAGTGVRVSAENYANEQHTDEEGEVVFRQIPRSSLASLVITIQL